MIRRHYRARHFYTDRLWAPLLLLLLAAVACRSAPTNKPPRRGWSQRGWASWYGLPFHGRLTANGETYDMYGLTAAHRTLPFDTVLEVHNLDNDRRVRVRVNDRGPFVKGRIIDLSYGAAQALGMEKTGLARVEITVVGNAAKPPPAPPPQRVATSTARYTVQVGAFRARDHAEEVVHALEGDFSDVRIEEESPWYRVRVGSFGDRTSAEKVLRRIVASGFAAIVVAIDP